MKITLFDNLYCKEASGAIEASEWVEAIRCGKYRATVEQIRDLWKQGRKEEAKEMKMKLPAVVIAGLCMKGRYYKFTTERTGWAMFDFDDVDAKTMTEAVEKMKECKWVVMMHVTSSGRGLRIVVNMGMVHVDVYRDAYEVVAEWLQDFTGMKPDMQCKDFARTSLASYDPDIFFNQEAEVFHYGERDPFAYVPVTEQDCPEDFRIPKNVFGNDCTTDTRGQRYENRERIDATAVIDRFFAGNTYEEGSRHGTLLRLGRYMKWMGVDACQMGAAMSTIYARTVERGMTEKEVRMAVMWGYEKGKERPSVWYKKNAQSAHHNNMNTVFLNNADKNSENEDNMYEERTEEDIINECCRALPDSIFEKLPEELKKLLVIAKDRRERDVVLLSSISVLSGLFPALRTIYGNQKCSAHLYFVVVAEAGGGKGMAMHAAKLAQKINAQLDKMYKAGFKEYEKKMFLWDIEVKESIKGKRAPDMDLKPEEPVRQVLVIMANISKSQLLLYMKAGENVGLIMIASEIDVVSESLNTDYGKHGAELRMFFHHEPVGQNFKTDKNPIEVLKPKMAILMTGTPEQLVKFMKSLENGMYSRFMFYMMNSSVKWKSQSPLDGNGAIDADELFGELAEKLKVNFFNSLGKEIMIKFTREQWNRHSEVFGLELDMLMVEGVPNTGAIAIRAGLIMIRVAMVLSGLRLMEAGWQVNEYTCTDEDFDTAMEITLTCFAHSTHISTMIKNSPRSRKMSNFYRLMPVLKTMKNHFRYHEFRDAVLSIGSNISAARRALEHYVANGLLSKTCDGFRKTEKLKRMFRKK